MFVCMKNKGGAFMKTITNEHSDQVEMRFLEGVRNRCPKDSRVLKALGDLYTRAGNLEKGLDVDRDLVRMCPDEPDVWYNLGCSHALVGEKEAAFNALSRAVELGYSDRDWMSRDDDLRSIRNDPRFRSLLHQLRD